MLCTDYVLSQFYRSTSRELQRLDSVSRSPMFALFSETLSETGLPHAVIH